MSVRVRSKATNGLTELLEAIPHSTFAHLTIKYCYHRIGGIAQASVSFHNRLYYQPFWKIEFEQFRADCTPAQSRNNASSG